MNPIIKERRELYKKIMPHVEITEDTVIIKATLKSVHGDFPYEIVPKKEHVNFQNKALVIEEGVTSLKRGAFFSFNWTSISLPSTLKKIGADVFVGVDSPECDIHVPESVIDIGSRFCSESNLRSVLIPTSVKKLKQETFVDSQIKILMLPKTTVENDEFYMNVIENEFYLRYDESYTYEKLLEYIEECCND